MTDHAAVRAEIDRARDAMHEACDALWQAIREGDPEAIREGEIAYARASGLHDGLIRGGVAGTLGPLQEDTNARQVQPQ